jgi:hypothetical protein
MPTPTEIQNHNSIAQAVLSNRTEFTTYFKRITTQEIQSNTDFDTKLASKLAEFKLGVNRLTPQDKETKKKIDNEVEFSLRNPIYNEQYKTIASQIGWATPNDAPLLNINYGSSLLTSAQSLRAGIMQSAVPLSGQIARSITSVSLTGNSHPYAYVPYNQLTGLNVGIGNIPIKFSDFRSRRYIGRVGNILYQPLDGAFAAATNPIVQNSDDSRKPALAVFYAAAAASPAGAYSIFNRELGRNFGVGWGQQGDVGAIRNDFTLQSEVATKWQTSGSSAFWNPKQSSKFIPFRGDKVTVIDFGQRDYKNIYQWRPVPSGSEVKPSHLSQDFIKFYFTGPDILPNGTGTDDVIVFRATIDSLSDSFNPQWTPNTIIGRADPNYHYSSYSRDLQFSFTIYATDADELKPIWRKLNALSGYTAPTYDTDTIAMIGPWMRLTIGDLFVQQPGFISSLNYTLVDSDTTWEINLLQQPDVMQVPKKINVNVGFTLVTNELPQKGGKFYSLAKQFESSSAKTGTDNWLSDFKDNRTPVPPQRREGSF